LEHVWDLEGDNQPLFAFSNFKPIYILLANRSDSPNDAPFTPSHPRATYATELNAVEATYQLSFKNKLMHQMPVLGGSLWFAYTQVSHWQIYNAAQSSPFRANDYEPQFIYSLPIKKKWGVGQHLPFDMRWKVLNAGLVHQSNGQSGDFSRSWNRIYAEFGLENQHLTILLRPWWRLPEPAANDDNPDITRYMGHGELRMIYNYGRQYLSLLGRYNANSQHGAAQLDYVFPIRGKLQGYVKMFSGYGESLIDYNHHQNTIGFGVLIKPWKGADE